MTTNLEPRPQAGPAVPRPLPPTAVPEGCVAWSGDKLEAWARTRPPVWVPARTRPLHLLAVVPGGLVIGFWLANFAEIPAALAVLVPLQLVWTLVRPEVVRFSAPLLMLLLAWRGGSHDVPTLLGLTALTFTWAAAEIRLSKRGLQRQWAVAAAEGATATVPDEAGPVRRGRFLMGAGLLLALLGAALLTLASGRDGATDRDGVTLVGWFVVGWGLTALLSGWLGRRRAAALRGAPVPVLRVLVRDGADGDAEVFAADDVEARRPLFTVAAEEWYDDGEEESEEDGAPEGAAERDERDELLDAIEFADDDDEQPGPLREAVLYGPPHEGAEIVIVSAAERPDAPEEPDAPEGPPDLRKPAERDGTDTAGSGTPTELVVESSSGPVRPLSARAVRRRGAAQRARARRSTVHEELRATAAARSRQRLGDEPVPVRRWRAGWADWTAALLTVVVVVAVGLYPEGLPRYVVGALVGLVGVLTLPRLLAWRITADRTGLWLSDWRRTRHIEWDDLTTVRCAGPVLTVDSRQESFTPWSVRSERWRWLERRLRLVHPYERTAAEITAMWREPALRPAGEYPGRGMPLWPLGVVLAVAWAAVLVLAP
ncbi:hypothetical protein [Streptomyces stelliscabiei]|uniref:Uncharacterized protein n=1 Tax=Streptomyces stelliscabiei TaxID=146820 RepID=A0A8I0P4Y5_9ACTN|nr:hypothetical protein [Streptomyces stelliscabiei]KND30667.1 membrane protein [Streptomyces stelliscabiei]MBE1599623.1 hypothetical protein [Streptomyces stelliscabiei]MDX2519638.1 hypothetical protein [Streptomyces stelliscabiei]